MAAITDPALRRKGIREVQKLLDEPMTGSKLDMDIEQVREFIKNQKRMKGFNQAVASGTGVRFDLELSGDARLFLGWALLPPVPTVALSPQAVSLTINNEIIVDQVHPIFFSQAFMEDEYYFIPRPLNGTDSITMTYDNSQLAQNFNVIIYYI